MGHHDPVISDTARYYAQLDRQDAYHDEIYRRACELQAERVDDVIAEIYEHDELKSEFLKAFGILIACKTEPSGKAARDDLCAVAHEAATRLAKYEYKLETQAAIESLAVDRYYAQMERIRG